MGVILFLLPVYGIFATLFGLPGVWLLWVSTALAISVTSLVALVGICSRPTLEQIYQEMLKKETETSKAVILTRRILGYIVWGGVLYCASIAYPAFMAWFILGLTLEILFAVIYYRYKARNDSSE